MPTVLRKGSYRFFLTPDCDEPPHVHIQQGKQTAKFWLDPVKLARPGRFKEHELSDIEHLVADNQGLLFREWEKWCKGYGNDET